MAATVLHLVRHAQPALGEDVDDPALSELGLRQAAALGERLRRVPVSEVHHGPSRRTTGTAERLATALPGIVPQVSEHLRDRTPVPSAGQAISLPEQQQRWLRSVPEAERDEDGAGIDAALAHYAVVGAADRHVVLVTHSFVIGWCVGRVLGLPWDGWMGLQPRPTALTVVTVRVGAPPVLDAYDDDGHLP